MMNTLFFAVLVGFQVSFAADPVMPMSPFPKEDIQIHEKSLGFLKHGFPQKTHRADWMGHPMRTLLVRAKPQYRHMPAVLVAAFSAQKKDELENAFKWLEVYECENYLACLDFEQFLNKQIVGYGKSMNGILRIRADKILARVQNEIKSAGSPIKKEAFCLQDQATRQNWLKLAYQLYCAPYEITSDPRGCAMLTHKPQSCSATEGLVNSIERWTGSDSNSGRITHFEQTLEKGCEKQWTVKMDCDNKGQIQKLEFTCESQTQKYPAQVNCISKN
jgi:hypothetical protein